MMELLCLCRHGIQYNAMETQARRQKNYACLGTVRTRKMTNAIRPQKEYNTTELGAKFNQSIKKISFIRLQLKLMKIFKIKLNKCNKRLFL